MLSIIDKNLKSVAYWVLPILFFFFFPAGFMYAAELGLNPESGTYVTGSLIPVDVLVDTEGDSVNAVSGEIVYDPSQLIATSISRIGSVVDLWLEEPSVKSPGVVEFEGLILNPGFSGVEKIVTINFDVISPGETEISFLSGLVLANDGFGTNVANRLGASSFVLRQSGVEQRQTRLPQAEPETYDVLPPVVLTYTKSPHSLDELQIRGITYPHAKVGVYLQRSGANPEEYQTVSDAGGNFIYIHKENADTKQLLTANVFSVLDALTKPGGGNEYSFWLTAVRQDVESPPTQPFNVVVGPTSPAIVFIVIGMLVIILLGLLWFFYNRRLQDKKALQDMRKNIGSISYDIEKYEAKKRQEANRDNVRVQ